MANTGPVGRSPSTPTPKVPITNHEPADEQMDGISSNIGGLPDSDDPKMSYFADTSADYSTRLSEVLDDEQEHEHELPLEDVQEEYEDTWKDVTSAEVGEGEYEERMRAAMGLEDSEKEVEAVEGMLDQDDYLPSAMDEVLPDNAVRQGIDITAVPGAVLTPPSPSDTASLIALPPEPATPSKQRPAFLHPSVSRLRSFQPVHHRMPSSSSMASMNTLASLPNGASPALSHFSDVSGASTPSRLDDMSAEKESVTTSSQIPNPRQPFRWNTLHALSPRIYPPTSSKSSAVLGLTSSLPTTLAANGLLCIGKSDGSTHVFDFRQQLKCICGNEASGKEAGPVTALALSHDHTFLAVGHAQGHMYLYDLSRPQAPARAVPPTTMAAVASGQKEGHLSGSAVNHLSFIGARHTALVSADKSGLAFYHSLGKVLFIEASDVLRILGRYPDEMNAAAARNTSGSSTPVIRSRSTILSMSALPLGPAAHPTEAYNLIAILTPAKLVVVGLRPSPRTWFRHHRDIDSSDRSPSQFAGCLAWFPSFADSEQTKGRTLQERPQASSRPVLAYSWGHTVTLMRVDEDRQSPSKVPAKEEKRIDEIGKVTFEPAGKWSADRDILALIWLNQLQLLVFTAEGIDVIDVRKMMSIERTGIPSDYIIANRWAGDAQNATSTVAHCIKAYKGKLFLLGEKAIRAGTLLSWTDHILMFIKQGDFLSAIDLCRSYLTGEATGNKAGLPEDPETLRQVVGEKMSELMVASARFAFSEDRMRDSTHDAPDGRGVDRTWLFEKMVSTCAEACLTLGDNDFLFNDLYERYHDSAIDGIYLTQLEPFVLDGRIRTIPPHISQGLIAMHDDREEYEQAEALIWHMDPLSLDINQVVRLCRAQQLYDALIYVYTQCLKDYVTPIVDLLLIIREIRLRRSGQGALLNGHVSPMDLETLTAHAYKVYAYLGDVLTGVEYPSNGQMDEDDATSAKGMVYAFLFFGRTSQGEAGHLVLTTDEDGLELSYPYLRMLLQFDAEAFLHMLDLAFEDSYLNDAGQGVNRQLIINVLLDISHLHDLQPEDATFLRIFIARNAPKYPQFVRVTPSTYDRLLLDLASDPDASTREDRQLAAEYLLSAYTPHDGDRLVEVFERAGFYRILRSIYTQERKWPALLSTYLRDTDLPREELFASLDKTLTTSRRSSKGALPGELREMLLAAIPRLIDSSISETTILIDNHLPSDHTRVLEAMPPRSYQQFVYLRYMLEPHLLEGFEDGRGLRKRRLDHIDATARHLYIELICEYDSSGIIRAIQSLPDRFLDLQEVIQTCNERGLYAIEIWSLDREGQPSKALDRLEVVMAQQANALVDLAESGTADDDAQVEKCVSQLRAITEMGLRICQERSKQTSTAGLHIEEMWFRLLYSEVNMVQLVSGAVSPKAASKGDIPEESHSGLVESLRALVQETLIKLISTPTSRSASLSFPALFARLVDSISASHHASTYSEFRTILTGMLGHYRSEADTLGIVGHLVGQDLFSAVEEKTRIRKRGWPAKFGSCDSCGRALSQPEPKSRVGAVTPSANGNANGTAGIVEEAGVGPDDVVIGFSGFAYHKRCFEALGLNTLH
ncbi:hypothetical protein CALVIDRAFT_162405 [Calocera viscosa TUFC12733]|uniref:Uncharacterized protein n=1 Tax=Calocera viscosa (strain TUFC12733) TaxID=1330018 RepID=A0A167LDQ9_CALVF|nr:hypothetical protein CALVIDRAFT_162405 [Calocera viscosa TUFC12733]